MISAHTYKFDLIISLLLQIVAGCGRTGGGGGNGGGGADSGEGDGGNGGITGTPPFGVGRR